MALGRHEIACMQRPSLEYRAFKGTRQLEQAVESDVPALCVRTGELSGNGKMGHAMLCACVCVCVYSKGPGAQNGRFGIPRACGQGPSR